MPGLVSVPVVVSGFGVCTRGCVRVGGFIRVPALVVLPVYPCWWFFVNLTTPSEESIWKTVILRKLDISDILGFIRGFSHLSGF